MKIRSLSTAATIGFALSLMQGVAAEAAEVKVMAGVAMRAVWEELGPQFERATGHKLVIWYGFIGTIRERMEAGEAFDVAVFGKGSLDEYTKQGKIAADTHTAIARVGMGMAARAGAPKPDIGSVEAFKRALLDAKSVTYQPKGGPGIHMTSVFRRLGITEQMKAKYRRQQVAEGKQQSTLPRIASGEAEFGEAQTQVPDACEEITAGHLDERVATGLAQDGTVREPPGRFKREVGERLDAWVGHGSHFWAGLAERELVGMRRSKTHATRHRIRS